MSIRKIMVSLLLLASVGGWACPDPSNFTNPAGLTVFRSGIYRIYFCQLPEEAETSHTLEHNDLFSNTPRNMTVGIEFIGVQKNDSALRYLEDSLSKSTQIIKDTVDISGINLKNKLIITIPPLLNFYSRVRGRSCSTFDNREYKYIASYLRGGDYHNNPDSERTGNIFSAIDNSNTKKAEPIGNHTDIAIGKKVAQITGLELKHNTSSDTLTADLIFTIHDKKEIPMGWSRYFCQLIIRPELIIENFPNNIKPGSYDIKINIAKP